MNDETKSADVPEASAAAAEHASLAMRLHAWLFGNRSKLYRTSPLRPVRLAHFLIFLVALGLAWRVLRYALGFPIWGDEAFVAVNLFERDYVDMLEPLIYGQIVPLVFMWAELAVSRLLGFSEWSLHLLPFLAGIVAVPLFWRFATTTLKPRAAFLAIGVFAAAYYTVRHAAEVKPYSFDLLVALELIMLGWSVYSQPCCKWRWAGLIVLAGLAPWCSYPSVFVTGTVGLLLAGRLLRGGLSRTTLIGCLIFAVVGVGSFGWMYLAYGHPHAQAASKLVQIDMWAKTFPPLLNPWKFVLWFLYMHLGNMMAYPIGGSAPASIVTFAMVVVGSAHLWRNGQRALLWLLLGPLALTFVAACFHKYPYGGSARTTQYLAPAICILMGLGVYATFRRFTAGPRLAVCVRLFGVFCAAVASVGAAQDIIQPYKSDRTINSQNAVLRIVEQSGQADRWIVFNSREQAPYASFIGDLRGTGAQYAFNVMRFCPGTVEWAPPPESVARNAGDGNIWLLAYRSSRSDLKENSEFDEYEREFSRVFEEYRERLSANLGPPTEHEDIFVYTRTRDDRERRESLDVYRFSP